MNFNRKGKSKYTGLIILGAIIILALGIYIWAETYTTNYDEKAISDVSCLDYPSGYNYA